MDVTYTTFFKSDIYKSPIVSGIMSILMAVFTDLVPIHSLI